MGTALKPGIYAAWIPKGAECLRLSVYAVCIPGSQKANADTSRRTGMPSPAAADAVRRIAQRGILPADTCRETVQPQCAFLRPSVHVSMVPKGAEILRPAMFAAMHPLLRGRGTARAGAGRKVVRFISVAADTKRSILRPCAATADIRRALGRRKAAAMDALRRIRNRQRAIADTSPCGFPACWNMCIAHRRSRAGKIRTEPPGGMPPDRRMLLCRSMPPHRKSRP